MIKQAILVILLLLCGCTVKGKVSDTTKGKHMSCVDTRDGERFGFSGRNITNVRIGLGVESCVTLKDDSGKVRELCSNQEAWIKCNEVGATKGPQ